MLFAAASAAAATWPLGLAAAMAAERAAPSAPARPWRAAPFAPLADHVAMQIACLPRLVLVAATYWYCLRGWRVFAAELAWRWVLAGVARDVGLALAIGGVTDFLLLADASPFRAAMAPHKFNAAYPALLTRRGTAPVARDIALSCVSAALAGLLEALVLHAYATGRARAPNVPGDAWWTHGPTVVLMLSWFYSQNVHFYALHRCMHAWRVPGVPDVGAWLYRHVHSVHHGARNPTAFSGIAMHPVAFIYIKANLICAAMLGHAGFEYPAAASWPHFLHHSLVQVNYAENHVPLDWLFGTFAADEKDAEASIARRFGAHPPPLGTKAE